MSNPSTHHRWSNRLALIQALLRTRLGRHADPQVRLAVRESELLGAALAELGAPPHDAGVVLGAVARALGLLPPAHPIPTVSLGARQGEHLAAAAMVVSAARAPASVEWSDGLLLGGLALDPGLADQALAWFGVRSVATPAGVRLEVPCSES
ncbi:MAG: hypothetical protein ACI8PZ_003864 [Myxococcota bacterium]|jgi:hypothetical protein